MPHTVSAKPMYRKIRERLERDIAGGRYAAGEKFPSEAALVQRFGASRITVGRAVRELQERGLLDRVAGSGTYVRGTVPRPKEGLLFGLVIPDLGETEIFEPICQGIAASPEARGPRAAVGARGPGGGEPRRAGAGTGALLHRAPGGGRVLCAAGVQRGERGGQRARDQVAARRGDRGGAAGPPAGGFGRTARLRPGGHRQSSRRIPGGGAPVAIGCAAGGLRARGGPGIDGESARSAAIRMRWRSSVAPVTSSPCGPITRWSGTPRRGSATPLSAPTTAWRGAGCRRCSGTECAFRNDVRIVGIDDVNYASLLPVPLTTVHQPCREIGETALRVMLERLERPKMAARDVLLDCTLVIRQSCGARIQS